MCFAIICMRVALIYGSIRLSSRPALWKQRCLRCRMAPKLVLVPKAKGKAAAAKAKAKGGPKAKAFPKAVPAGMAPPMAPPAVLPQSIAASADSGHVQITINQVGGQTVSWFDAASLGPGVELARPEIHLNLAVAGKRLGQGAGTHACGQSCGLDRPGRC